MAKDSLGLIELTSIASGFLSCDAMLKAAQPNAKSGLDYMSFDPQSYRVQQEIALEQQFAILAADENPEKAIKLISINSNEGSDCRKH